MCDISLYQLPAEFLQALHTLKPSTPAHQKCLGELRGVCCARRMLPRSYIPRICMDRTPGHDHCGLGEIFRWTLSGLFVESRRIFPLRKVFSPEGEEVGVLRKHRHVSLLIRLTKITAPLQRSQVETFDTSEHPPFPQLQSHMCRIFATFYAHTRLDTWKRIESIYQQQPDDRPTRSR